MDAGGDFALAVEHDPEGAVVRITGDLDMATAPQLRECLSDLKSATAILDFSGVTFMDSGGIAVLAWAMKRARQGGPELKLRGVRPAQMQVLEITGIAGELDFEGDR